MKRKLCSIVLSAFAMLLLIGADAERESNTTILTASAVEMTVILEEETAPVAAEPGVSLDEAEVFVPPEEPEIQPEPEIQVDSSLLVNGEAVELDTQKTIVGGVSYVALRAMAEELDETVAVSWTASTATVTLTTAQLTLSVSEGDSYLIANGRYLYLPQGIQVVDGVTMVPLTVLAEAFDATVQWDASTSTISVTTGSGGILPGDAYYNSDNLFWLSRIIFAESGSEMLDGKIGVGNVVLNRVANPLYPNTLLEVIAQKNQFSTYKNGSLANRTPNESSIIAAKLVMDGAVIAGLETATHFDTGGSTWASKNKTCVAVIGGHKFYG